MPAHSPHLLRDDLLRAVIDPTDLSAVDRRHLEHCSTCQSQLASFSRQLEKLSETTARQTPVPRPRTALILAGEKPIKKQLLRPRRLIPAISTAIILLVGLMSLWIFSPMFDGQTAVTAPTESALLDDRQAEAAFAAEIEHLETYALSGFTRQSDAIQYTSDDFLNFLVPLPETKTSPETNSDMSFYIRSFHSSTVLT